MKVLKDGKHGDPGTWKATVFCRKQDEFDPSEGCGAELEVRERDLTLMYWHGTHFPHYYAGVKCPQCGHRFAVKDVPDPIWQRLNTAKRRANATFDGFSEEI